ncbi:class I SAM-dependent methyltransferase [Sphingosinicella sp. BN140058]|uniref:class I SAM-dependent methyltransferase n=1 Tax=Sphingosinicella sp. BN140058 TaxID=1892855 RepID=UPI001011F635|nr:class I SAM-dependent methyltransferase [Sphingosinicella sp. BN140058]QAY77836.1 class I SAM-dependent methyltransferase [Sphingosinicella sp. BN140058]
MTQAHSTAEEQAALWNGDAGRSWVAAQSVLDGMFQPIEDDLAGWVAEAEVRSVLDVGCGTGSTTIAMARRLGGGADCTGIDISEPMLAAARSSAAQESVGAAFLCADAQSHPLPAGGYDAIVSRFGVMFFADPVRAFANLRRASAPGAALRMFAWRSPADNPFMTTAERAAAPLLPEMPARDPDAPGQFAFADRNRILSILEQSGWTAGDVRPFDFDCALPEARLEEYFTRFGPIARYLRGIEGAALAEIVATVRAAFEPYVRGEDVRFTAACWLISARAPGAV